MTDGHDSPDVPPRDAEVGGVRPANVLTFWFEELSPGDHFNGGERVDAMIRDRFGDLVEGLAAAGYPHIWESEPETALALLIALDQFPRNIHRDGASAYLLDNIALDVAMRAIGRDFHTRFDEDRAKYVLMPLMHSEDLEVQDKGVELFDRFTDPDTALHARAHRNMVAKFGRFPARNQVLSRETTDAEREWMEGGGYGSEVRALKDNSN